MIAYEELEAKQQRIVDWLMLPKSERPEDCKTIEELADRLDLGVATVYRYKKQYDLQKVANERAKDQLADALPEVLHGLKKNAEEGSFRHLQLYLQMLGVLTDTKEIKFENATQRRKSEIQEKLKRLINNG